MKLLHIEYARTGSNGTALITAKLGDDKLACEKVDVLRIKQRDAFASRLCEHHGAIDRAILDKELLRIAEEISKPAPMPHDAPEIEPAHIVRPELFHVRDVSGISVPVRFTRGGEAAARWYQFLRWSDGKRERRTLESTIALPDNSTLFLHPVPGDPSPTMTPTWSADSRRAWLDGAATPNPSGLFKRICEAIAQYVELPPESASGSVATLALWIILTYVFPAWSAIPYLSIGGPLGSGKSTLFAVLGRLVFRALQSSNMTAPCLFRTLHEQGGALLLDEAERLRDGSPEAGELRSILLSGYKGGSPAMRLEKVGDGFQQVAFDVFGPKAMASIANPPEALASRCLRFTMFRAGPDSPKPRRRIDANPAMWQAIRDDLHTLALENGAAWLDLAGRSDVVPTDLAGRDYELWQPVLALATFIESHGAKGLLRLMQDHALSAAADGRDEATPEADETLLRIVAEAVLENRQARLKAGDVLKAAREIDPSTFDRWSARGITGSLGRYGIRTNKTAGSRVFARVTLDALRRIQRAYGIELPIPPQDMPYVPHVPQSGDSGAENEGTL